MVFVRRFLSDESGQTTVEYILLLTLTISVSGLILKKITGLLDDGIVKLGAQLELDLKTGRMPSDAWKN